jgi:MBG domain (YGX type)/Bacterial Ig-like domain (group 3)/FG-GAP-like repeat/Beta-propeller repeat
MRNATIRGVVLSLLLCTLSVCADAQISGLTGANCHVIRWGGIPLSFEPNLGQESPDVHYLARGSSYSLYLADGEMRLGGRDHSPLRMKLLGANRAARIVGEAQQDSTSNYFVGNDPTKWRTSVPNYGRARYLAVYPGIDLVYYGHDGNLEYDWIVSPQANARRIRLAFDGADRVRLDKHGDLVVNLGRTEYRHRKPVVYQECRGKRIEIAGAWTVRGKEAAFRIGTYDHGQPLVIDPVVYYSTYEGGSGLDFAYAIAVDKVGNTYVTGGTGSTNFPTSNSLQPSLKGSEDVFITKINANGSARLYSTYLGGGGPDEGKGIAVNSQGEVYVTGNAGSFDFPMMGAVQGTWGGSGDAFLTKLNASGSGLVYSTYLGGNAIDYATAVALDPTGNAYITGVTFSTNFPTVNPFQTVKGAQQDAFVAKINPAGTAWVYATFLGGNNVDEAYAIAADASGTAYVTGYTASTDFPLQSPYRSSNVASVDAFVTKLNPAGSALVYSTYLGGSATDYATGIAVDSVGSAYVTGIVGSSDFPTVNPIQLHLAGADDAFVTKFDPSGSALVYSTYFGGGSADQPYALAIDQSGNAWITGRTNSSDFPLVNPIQTTRVAFDMFITEISANGSASRFSSFLGGTGSESGRGIAVDRLGNVHVAGESTSADFPVVNALQSTNGGGAVSQDAIVLALGNSPRLPYTFNDFAGNGCEGGEILYDPSNGQGYAALTNSDGTYNYVGSALSSGSNVLRTGDFNGDGKADLIMYNSQTAEAQIGFGNGDGTFTFQPLVWSAGYDFVETGDLNGDGETDIVLYNSSTGTMYTGISNGTGTFTYTYHLLDPKLTYVRLADFTGDGKADLFLYGKTGLAYLGVSDGSGNVTIKPLSFSSGYDFEDVGDLNGDGKADVILYNSATGDAVTGISNGTGGFAFTALLLPPGFTSVRLADYTGDGNADVTLYNTNNGLGYLGTGTATGTFNLVSVFWSPGYDWVVPEDINCDGKADVILYNSATGTEYTGISQGDGLFSYTFAYWGLGNLLVDQNHLAAVPTTGSLVITASSASLLYGGAVPAITPSYAGFVNGDTAATLTTLPTCTTTASSSSPVGTYPTVCSGAADGNYTITYQPGAISITPAPLTITASSGAMVYGGPVPGIAPSFSGFVNGENASVLAAQPTCSTSATSTSSAGSSLPSSCTGATAGNYAIAYVPGTVTVSKATSTTTITSLLPSPAVAQQAVTIAFAVAPQFTGTPTGIVTVTASNGQSCNATVTAGTGSCQLTFTTTGTLTLSASYSGDANLLGSLSPVSTETVTSGGLIPTTTTLSSSNILVQVGRAVTFAARVRYNAGTPPNGELVTFNDSGNPIGTSTITSGAATLTTTSLGAGLHRITATYGGDATLAGSVSAVVVQIVIKDTTKTVLTSSLNPALSGQAVTFSASVTTTGPFAPSGTITFRSGRTIFATVPITNGAASYTARALRIGSNFITASYNGDSNNLVSLSSVLTENVR